MKEDPPGLDLAHAHGHFAPDCFNRAWTLIDLDQRSAEQDEQMLLLSLASLWHWTQRPDVTPRNLAIGHWQASRVYALRGDAPNAHRHAQRSLSFTGELGPFFLAYAHEALARAARVAGDRAAWRTELARAQVLAAEVHDAEKRAMLDTDLRDLSAEA